jgi:uncharacterized sulfatase
MSMSPRMLQLVIVLAIFAGFFVGLTPVEAAKPPAADRKPNIILILADDLGYGELGCYGQQKMATPRIDRLASQGMRFTDFYAGSTVCAPSRCVLMTGLHTGHATVRGNARSGLQAIAASDVTLATVLKQAGYATALTGKWGLGEPGPEGEPGMPDRHGFDHFFGYYSQVHAHNYYPDTLYRNRQPVALPNVGDFKKKGAGKTTQAKVYAPDVILDETLKFITDHRDKPFFVYCAWTLPHANNEDPVHGVPSLEPYTSRDWPEPNRRHAAMVTYLDAQVGKLLDHLDQLGLADNTIVLFTSDNGPHTESGGNDPAFFQSSGPFRGTKRSLTDGGIRVPLIVRWPAAIAPGSISGRISYQADIMPTLAQIAGTSAPTAKDGLSLLPALRGQTSEPHRYLYWEFYEGPQPIQAIRFGNFKAHRSPILTGPITLYDITTDPTESTNLASTRPDLVEQAQAFMNEAHTPSPRWPTTPRR